MSSQKRIGRWKRFEIAYAERKSPQNSPFQVKRTPTTEKTRGLGEMEKDASGKTRGLGEMEKDASRRRFESRVKTSEWEPKLKSEAKLQLKKSLELSPKATETANKRSRTSSPSLWEEARQKQKNRDKGKNDGRR